MLGLSILVWLSFIGGASAYTLEECEIYRPTEVCYSSYEMKYFSSFNLLQECEALSDYIGCMEKVGCDCNLTISYEHNAGLTTLEYYYVQDGCLVAVGDLPEKYGIVCDKWNHTESNSTHGGMIDLQFSAAEYIVALDKNCSGVRACYSVFDDEGALAVYNRNQSELCLSLDRLILCLDEAVCACGEDNATATIYQIYIEDYYFRQLCANVNDEEHTMIPKLTSSCHANGTVKPRTHCDTPDPTEHCYTQYINTLLKFGDSNEMVCPAVKTYVECTEKAACDCGLLGNSSVYFTLTTLIDYFNRTNCIQFSAPINVLPGMECPDGSSTANITRILLSFADSPFVKLQDDWCPGIKKCYQDFDQSSGVALFEKNNYQLCLNNKAWVECLELTYCQCGVYDYYNTTNELDYARLEHQYSCYDDVILRDDYECEYGNIGFKCDDNNDCLVVEGSVCTSLKVCACGANTKYIPANMTCTIQVSGAHTPAGAILLYLVGLVFVMAVGRC